MVCEKTGHAFALYQLVVNPIIIGNGKRLFAGVTNAPKLTLVKTRAFKSGNVFTSYRPA